MPVKSSEIRAKQDEKRGNDRTNCVWRQSRLTKKFTIQGSEVKPLSLPTFKMVIFVTIVND